MSVYGLPVVGCLALANQSSTMPLNSSVLMPECVAARISTMACSPWPSALFRSPLSREANGSLSFHSGCCGASAFTRSIANRNWKYSGCSAHSVPSLSKTAMRSSGLTKSGPPSLVTLPTKSMIACFDAPSLHDGSASCCAWADRPATSARNRNTTAEAPKVLCVGLIPIYLVVELRARAMSSSRVVWFQARCRGPAASADRRRHPPPYSVRACSAESCR